MEPTHLSLFTGIGGIDLAAEWAGFKTIGQCEINPYCLKVLEKNFPDVKRWNDVKQLTGKEIIQTIGTPTLISGGFPCQPHSAAGKRKASCDDRDLWPEIRRILGQIKPRWFVGENVSGLRSSEKGIFFGKILNDLDSLGYNVAWGSWEAGHLNAPHHRERLFIVAHAINNDHRPEPGTLPEAGGLPENNRKTLDTGMSLGTNSIPERNAHDTLCERGGGGYNGNTEGMPRALQTPGSDCNAPHLDNTGSRASGYGDLGHGQETHQGQNRFTFGQSCRQDCNAPDTQPREHTQCVHISGDGWFQEHIEKQWRDPWYEVASKFCRVDDGVPKRLDKDRVRRLQCLGNAVVPQQVYPLLKEIYDFEMLQS
jgi:site-specific DNA-cytosine methylase